MWYYGKFPALFIGKSQEFFVVSLVILCLFQHHISCLTWAAGRGYTEIVKSLLEAQAKVNTADKYGTTPLIWASRKGHKDIVESLLAEGANVDNAGMVCVFDKCNLT